MLCLKGKLYHIAMREVLSTQVFEVAPQETAVDAEDVVRFFYYAAMVYIGLKRFDEARQALLAGRYLALE